MTATPDTRSLPDPVRHARDAAARDAGVSPEQVEIVEYSAEQWPSTALGCPKPGMYYAQVIIPGYRVLLNIDGEPATYHTDTGTSVVRC